MRDGVTDRPENRVGHLGQAVVHPQAVTPGVHQAGLPEVGEMPGRFRLWDLQRLVDVAHADFARQQEAENSQPRNICQRLADLFHVMNLRRHIFVLTNIARGS